MGHNASKFDTDDPELLKLLESVMGNRKAANLFWSCLLEGSCSSMEFPGIAETSFDQHAKHEELGSVLSNSVLAELNDFSLEIGVSRFSVVLCAFAALAERYGDVSSFWIQHNYGLTGSTNRVLEYPVTRVEVHDGQTSLSFRDLCLLQHELIQKSSYHLCIPSLPGLDDVEVDRFFGVFLLDPSTGHTRESIADALASTQLGLLVELVDDRNMVLRLHYNASLFSVSRAQDIFDQLIFTLGNCLSHPDVDDVRHIPTVPAEQSATLIDQRVFDLPYATTVDFPELDCVLIDLIRAQAERTPDAIAVRQYYPSYEHLTYAELLSETEAVAAAIRSRFDMSVRNARIGILLNRGMHQVVAVLAVLLAGCAYVPMDPVNHPPERIEYIFRDSGAVGLVTESSVTVSRSFQSKFPTFVLDRESPRAAEHVAYVRIKGEPTDIAYVIYTSGSTGKPKGVLVPSRGVVNDIYCVFRHFLNGNAQLIANTLFSTNICFDAHVDELFLPLVFGGSLTCLDDTIARSAIREDWNVTFVQSTPSVFQVVDLPDSVACVLIGGETVTKSCLAKVMKQGRLVLNGYGPTETTNESSLHVVTYTDDVKSIGKPIWNTQFYILDKSGKCLVPKHAFGELYIGGIGVTSGYCNLPELTAQSFICLPESVGAGPSVLAYKTGDIVRINECGDLEFKGRKDSCGQIKLRGYRIELGEIQFALLNCNPDVKEAHVTVASVNNQQQIVAYIAPASVDLCALSYGQLPEYMKPSHVVRMKAFPRTISGKLDAKQLPVVHIDCSDSPQTNNDDTVSLVVRAMRETLSLPSTAPMHGSSNFFVIGGNSLNAVTLRGKLAELVGLPSDEVKLQMLLQLQTADKIALYVDQLSGMAASDPTGGPSGTDPVLVHLSTGEVPFFCIHAAGGQVHTYSSLAASVSQDASVGFCAIQDPSLSLGPSHRLTSFEALAAFYAQRIHDYYPQGPVFIGGHSSGGSIAFEVARSLASDFKREIGCVFLIDSDCPKPENSTEDQKVKLIERIDELRQYIYNGWKEGLMHDYIQAMTTMSEASGVKAWQLVKAVLPHRQSSSQRWSSDLLDMISLLSHHLQIEKRYSPFKAGKVDFPVILFKPDLDGDEHPGWAAVTDSTFSVVPVPDANHYSVVRQPAVDLVATVIRATMEPHLAPIRE